MAKIPRVDLRTPLVAAPLRSGAAEWIGVAIVVAVAALAAAAVASELAREIAGPTLAVEMKASAGRRPTIEALREGRETLTGAAPGDRIVAVEGVPLPEDTGRVLLGSPAWTALRGFDAKSVQVERGTELAVIHVPLVRGGSVRIADGLLELLGLAVIAAQAVLAVMAWRLRAVVSGARWIHAAAVIVLLSVGGACVGPVREVVAWSAPHAWGFARGGEPYHLASLAAIALLVPGLLLIAWLLEDFPEPDGDSPRRRVRDGLLTACVTFAMIAIPLAENLRARDARGAAAVLVAGTLVGLVAVYWIPALAWRVFRIAGRRWKGGTATPGPLQQARVAFLFVQLGFVAFGLPILVEIAWDLGDVSGGASPLPEPVSEALFALAFLLPPVGFILALKRLGMWQVPRARMVALTTSVLFVAFSASWLLFGVALDATLPEGVLGGPAGKRLASAAGSAVLVGLLRPPVAAWIGGRWFPQLVRFADTVSRAGEVVASVDPPARGIALACELLEHELGVHPIAAVEGDLATRADVILAHGVDARVVLSAIVPNLGGHAEAIAEMDDGPILVVRLGTRERPTGALLLGPRRGGLGYTERDKDVLRVLARVAGARLQAAMVPHGSVSSASPHAARP